jgi:hypothetical protein
VRAQLLPAQCVSGYTEDDLNPTTWEHDAVERRRQLYELSLKEGSDPSEAWAKAYDEGQ